MKLQSKEHDPYAALKYKEYRLFTAARFILTMGLQMQAVIIGWIIYSYTKDPLSLGLIGLTEALPSISISLYGGHLADRISRKRLILAFTSALLAASFILYIFIASQEMNFKQYGTFPVYFIIFLTGIARGFLSPAISAFGAQLVPKEVYINASAWNSSVWQLGAVSGPAVGGLIYGIYGGEVATGLVGIFILATITCYAFIKSKLVPARLREESLRESLFNGISFVFKSQVFVSAITLDLFAVFFGGAVALLPVFAGEILNTGPQGLGLLRVAPAFGAVITAIFLAYHPPSKNAGIKLLYAVGGFGLCMVLFAISTNFYISLVLLALSGMLDNVSVVIRSTIMQLMAPEEMRGRVSAVNSIFIGSSNEIGAFESGLAAKLLGVVPSVVFGGGMTMLITGVTARLAPKLRKLQL